MNQNMEDKIKTMKKEVNNDYGLSNRKIRTYEILWDKYYEYYKTNNLRKITKDNLKDFLKKYYNTSFDRYVKCKKREKEKIKGAYLLLNFDYYKNYIGKTLPKDDGIILNNINTKLINQYSIYCKEELYNSDNYIKQKSNDIKSLLKYLEDNNYKKITKLDKEILFKYINELDSHLRGKYKSLRCFFRYLYIEQIVNYDYSLIIPKLKNTSNKTVATYLDSNEQHRLLEIIKQSNKDIDKRNYAMVLLGLKTGLRGCDIRNLKFKNIDWINKTITIIQTKTNEEMHIPLFNDVGNAIIDYIKNYRPKTNSDYIFISHCVPYKKLTGNISEKIKSYFIQADIKVNSHQRVGTHSLRHSFATELLNNEVPLDIISKLMGQSNIESTKVYTKVDMTKLKKCGLDI